LKAAIFYRRGGPEEVQYADVPDPTPADGDVVVRVRACGMNHLDIYAREGSHGMKAPLPHIGGLEAVGEVAAVTPSADSWRVGERVLVIPFTRDGTCAYCRAGRDNLCSSRQIIGVNLDGGFAEYVRVPATCLLRIPDQLSFLDASAVTAAFGTAWHMLVTRAAIRPEEWVLVLAAGSGIGSAAIQVAKRLGCSVIATAGTPAKLEKALELGADHVINHTERPRFDRDVMRITANRGVDVVFEHIGPATWRQSLASLRVGGRLVTCGGSSGRMAETDVWNLFWKEFTVLGSMGATRRDLSEVVAMLAEGQVRPVIDRTFPLSETRGAQEHLTARRAFGKVVIIPE
jgi:NADPH:quinone reductase-like Zn-dependent oxidoreductase